jgi:hypothetical protein
MVRMSGVVLSDELFLRRLALGPHARVKGGTRSKRVLFLYARPGGLCICLNCENEEEGLARALVRLLRKRSLPVVWNQTV